MAERLVWERVETIVAVDGLTMMVVEGNRSDQRLN